MKSRPSTKIVLFIVLGLVAGFFSGMFGVGGGIIIVPGLIAIAGFSPRLAAGTSLLAILPLAAVGVISYAQDHTVSLVAGVLLAAGALVGAQVGTFLLSRINMKLLRIIFACFIGVSIVLMFVTVPSRDAIFQISWGYSLGLIVVGVVMGTLSGLLGIGGGVIVVPALMLLFHTSDLVAKGTSLLTMIPTALSGSVTNVVHKNVNVPAALTVGISASFTTFLGSEAAHLVSPRISNILFAIFLIFVAIRMLKGKEK